MNRTLADSRQHAAKASNLTSYPVIKATILRLVKENNMSGSFLDVGAGRGELVRLLLAANVATDVTGVDLFGRPDDLPPEIGWHSQDLNDPLHLSELFDVIVCSEVIEHLENPRALFRNLYELLDPDGALLITMPNQESLKAYMALLTRGHYNQFLGNWYPAHITALLRLDLLRICKETGFADPIFTYTNQGTIPKLPRVTWQKLSLGLLRGRLFSDNVAMITRKQQPTSH